MSRKMARIDELALIAYPEAEDRELDFRRKNDRIAYTKGFMQCVNDVKKEIWKRKNYISVTHFTKELLDYIDNLTK